MIKFSTKTNEFGNSLKLELDTENKTFRRGYFLFISDSRADVVLTKKELNKLADRLLQNGFTEAK